MKKTKKQKKEPSPSISLPSEQISYDSESPFGKVYRKKYFGKFSSSATVVFSLSLPHLLSPEFAEAEQLLRGAATEFLAFLEEKSRKETKDRFGGLLFSVTEQGFLLSAAFCPVKERIFLPAFSLFLSPEGKLLAAKKA